jgi:hypothetical protein
MSIRLERDLGLSDICNSNPTILVQSFSRIFGRSDSSTVIHSNSETSARTPGEIESAVASETTPLPVGRHERHQHKCVWFLPWCKRVFVRWARLGLRIIWKYIIQWPIFCLWIIWEYILPEPLFFLGLPLLGIIAGVRHWDPMAVFILNSLAVAVLAGVLSDVASNVSFELQWTLLGAICAICLRNVAQLIVSVLGSLRLNGIPSN